MPSARRAVIPGFALVLPPAGSALKIGPLRGHARPSRHPRHANDHEQQARVHPAQPLLRGRSSAGALKHHVAVINQMGCRGSLCKGRRSSHSGRANCSDWPTQSGQFGTSRTTGPRTGGNAGTTGCCAHRLLDPGRPGRPAELTDRPIHKSDHQHRSGDDRSQEHLQRIETSYALLVPCRPELSSLPPLAGLLARNTTPSKQPVSSSPPLLNGGRGAAASRANAGQAGVSPSPIRSSFDCNLHQRAYLNHKRK